MVLRLLSTIFIFISISFASSDSIDKSIVKIYTVSKTPNYLEPWNSTVRRSTGSGSIYLGNRILTNCTIGFVGQN